MSNVKAQAKVVAKPTVAEDLLEAVKELKAKKVGRKVTFEFIRPGVVRRTTENSLTGEVKAEELTGSRWEVVALRKKLKMNQDDFAKAMHVNARTLENWEQGRSQAKGPALQLIRLAALDPSVMDKLKCLS